jgi:hypothetical protein
MAKSIFCRVCKKGHWTEDDNYPDDGPCPRCTKKLVRQAGYNPDNFYGYGIMILAAGIDMGKPDGTAGSDRESRP